MPKLIVRLFSCIEDAELQFSPFTVLIGPQASGKSVLCKLAYFFLDSLHHRGELIEKGRSFEDYTSVVATRFREWFPVAAWGGGKFEITFEAGDYAVSILRTAYRGKVKDDFRLRFNDKTERSYKKGLEYANATKEKASKNEEFEFGFEFSWKVYEAVFKSSMELMGEDAIWAQSFIPAGRSFFTSIGKAVVAFEQGGMLDPLTIKFGRAFTSYKERSGRRLYRMEESKAVDRIKSVFAGILGGELKKDGDREFVLMLDGREIPLSALSSGQQELLPLITILPHLVDGRPIRVRGKNASSKRLVYIEEMEAHLFPHAQSKMVEALAMMRSMNPKGLGLMLTTHSPYVLAKINNLIYAGQLGQKRNPDLKASLESVVNKDSWLTKGSVSAYAIKDGVLVGIMDKDGFIDGDYLDSVSSDIANEFAQLQGLEYGDY